MQYHEYLNSARKHQYTCEELLKLIKVLSRLVAKENLDIKDYC